MDQDISSSHRSTHISKSRKSNPAKPLLAIGALVVIAIGSFYGGIDYQKHHQSGSSPTTAALGSGGFRGGGLSRDRVIGSVTTISPTSITVQNARTGSSSTLTITSSTTITDSGSAATVSDIQTGDTVFITENSSNTSDAASIAVNPSFGGPGGGGAPQSTTAPTTSTN